jgi:hypothetical protein
MPAVLTTAATVACDYQGEVAVKAAQPAKLLAGGHPVALSTDVATWTVASCKAMTPTTPSSATPCAAVAAPTAGQAAKLVVGGTPVLLGSFAAPTAGSAVPHAATVSDAGQTVLQAV